MIYLCTIFLKKFHSPEEITRKKLNSRYKELLPRNISFTRGQLESRGFLFAGQDIPGFYIFEYEGIRLYFKRTGEDSYQIFSL